MVLRHSAQTLLAPQEYDLKDFTMPVSEDASGSFAESIQTLQGLVFILDDNIELAKQQFQSVLEKQIIQCLKLFVNYTFFKLL